MTGVMGEGGGGKGYLSYTLAGEPDRALPGLPLYTAYVSLVASPHQKLVTETFYTDTGDE